ncbi:MAG TPA: crosslink repair DNA glycosylase YcaQ family protein [Chloroflexota bacterium]|nr:crosslink repair DNA glycosylase YcaQ family protein [Chloroflexota bacterium]
MAAGAAPVDVLDRLGAIQLDSVNAVARSQELVPAARLGPCSLAEMLHEIYARRRGFEYWGHAASWLPMAEYRYFLPRMAHYRERHRDYREEHAVLLGEILARIRDEGPLGAAAFEDPRPGRGTWWDWKPAKRALEVLFAGGELSCAGRTAGFARLYDLTERVLPAGLDTSLPDARETARRLLRRAIAALGVATALEAADYFRLTLRDCRPALTDLLDAGEVVPVAVEGWTAAALTLPAALAGPEAPPAHRPAFLSPFDNLIWERGRTERLFDFHFRLELYTPQARRPFGYYVLPLLADGRLAGRADVKLVRGPAARLRVHRLRLEGATPGAAATAVADLAAHLGAAGVLLERVEPEGALAPLRRALAAHLPVEALPC